MAQTIISYTGSPLAARWPGFRPAFLLPVFTNEIRATIIETHDTFLGAPEVFLISLLRIRMS